MSKKLYVSKPPLKVGEGDLEQGGGAFILFDEWVEIPGLEKADISLRFDRNNTYEEVREVVRTLKKMGFSFVVEK